MALDSTMPASSSATRSGIRSPWRYIGLLVAALLWAIFVPMAIRSSRFPVVLNRYSKEYAVLLLVVLAAAACATLAQVPRVFSTLYQRRHALLWLLVCCPLLIFGTVETAMRVFNLMGSAFYSEIRRYMTVLELDNRLFFKNPALYRGRYGHVEIVTNELGLRDRPLKPRAPDETRILVLGDSVTFGWGVAAEDAFPRQLEASLKGIKKGTIQTINSGVPGYNTLQELTFLRIYGDRLQPDAVILLYVDNDVDAIDPARVHMGVLPNPWKNPAGAADYFLSSSRLYFMLRHIIPVLIGETKPSPAERSNTPGWRQSMESLSDIARICRDRRIPLVVFHFRMLDDPVSAALNDEIGTRSRRDGFGFSDTLPWFSGANIRQLTNSFIDTHPNREGHRILADGMAHYLIDHAVLGPPSQIHRQLVTQERGGAGQLVGAIAREYR